MKRREFFAASCLAGAAPLSMVAAAEGSDNPSGKEFYELRLYRLEAGPKQKRFEDFCRQAAVPALNRIGIGPVGVFQMLEGDSPDVYVLLPHKSPDSFITLVEKLAGDAAFVEAGAEFLDAPFDDPAYATGNGRLSSFGGRFRRAGHGSLSARTQRAKASTCSSAGS